MYMTSLFTTYFEGSDSYIAKTTLHTLDEHGVNLAILVNDVQIYSAITG